MVFPHSILPRYRSVPLWSWNDRMTPGCCAAYVKQLRAAGFGGAYLHARLGMLISYMSPAYLAAIESSVATAAEGGVHAHLYDEDRWPSGWAGGAVPLADPAFRVKALVKRRKNECVAGDCRIFAESGTDCYCVVTMPLGHPKFNATCYTDLTNQDAVRAFIKHAYEPLETRLGSAFGRATPTIFTDEPALTYLYTWPSGGLPWSEALPERFFAATGRNLVDVIGGLFEEQTESAATRIHYYRILSELFAESFMRQISKWCRDHSIRWTGHFMYEHNLPLHFSWAVNCHASYRYFDWPGVDHLGRQVGEVVTALGCRSAVHQFAKERMMTELYGASGQHLSFADRKWIGEQQIVLGANHLVPHLMSTTLLGARKRDYPPTISPHQPWWPLNHIVEDHLARLCELMSEGNAETDLLLIHPQESIYALSRGPVAVGDADTWVGRFFHRADNARLNKMDDLWKQLCHCLLNVGYVFDFGDESVLAECGDVETHVEGPRLRVGAATYRAVVVPPVLTIRPSTIDLLTAFAEAGGIVAQLGDRPGRVDGSAADHHIATLEKLYAKVQIRSATLDALVERLLAASPPAIHITSATNEKPERRAWRYSKSQNDLRTTLLVNLDRLRTKHVRLKWRQPPGQPMTLWHSHLTKSLSRNCETPSPSPSPADGGGGLGAAAMSCRAAPKAGELLVTMPPGGSCVVVEGAFSPVIPPVETIPQPVRIVDAASLDWEVTPLDDNACLIDHAAFCVDDGIWRGPHPVLAIKEWLDGRRYVGSLSLRYAFSMGYRASSPLKLIVENIEQADVQVRVNGRAIDTTDIIHQSWCDPHWHPCLLMPDDLHTENCVEVAYDRFQHADPGAADAERRLGTEPEPIILLGNFAVDGTPADGPQGWRGQIEFHTGTPLSDWLGPQPMRYLSAPWVLNPPRRLTAGDVTDQGLPFYVGRIRYDAELQLPNPPDGGGIHLRLAALTVPVAAVEVNGQHAGCFAWPPYEVDVAPYLKAGSNRISITLYHSLRNLLGPHHHPLGEPVYVTPGTFRPERCNDWLETLDAGRPLPDWVDSYSFVQFGLFDGPSDGHTSATK